MYKTIPTFKALFLLEGSRHKKFGTKDLHDFSFHNIYSLAAYCIYDKDKKCFELNENKKFLKDVSFKRDHSQGFNKITFNFTEQKITSLYVSLL